MLGAHLDSVIDGPGINDDGSGVAALLEIARPWAARARGPRSGWPSGAARSSASTARSATSSALSTEDARAILVYAQRRHDRLAERVRRRLRRAGRAGRLGGRPRPADRRGRAGRRHAGRRRPWRRIRPPRVRRGRRRHGRRLLGGRRAGHRRAGRRVGGGRRAGRRTPATTSPATTREREPRASPGCWRPASPTSPSGSPTTRSCCATDRDGARARPERPAGRRAAGPPARPLLRFGLRPTAPHPEPQHRVRPPPRGARSAAPAPSSRRSGTTTSSPRTRARPPSSPSTSTSSTRSPRPQAFTSLRARGLRVRRPERTVATADHSTPTAPARPPDHRPDGRRPGEAARGQLRRVRDPDPRLRLRDPGDRPRHRPRAGPDPAGHDDRVRRQPHGDPRGVRGARLRDRDERGRDGPRHPDAPPAAAEDLRGPRRRPARAPASGPRTSSSPSSPGSGSAAAPATSSSTAARRSGRSRWSSG